MIVLHGRWRILGLRRSSYTPLCVFSLATSLIVLSVYSLIANCGLPDDDAMRSTVKGQGEKVSSEDGNAPLIMRLLMEKSRRYDPPNARLRRAAALAARTGEGSFDLCPAMIREELLVRTNVTRSGSKKTVFLAKWKRHGREGDQKEPPHQVVVKRNDFVFDEDLEDNILDELDDSEDGYVQRVEFFLSLSNALERMGITPSELDVTFAVADTNRDGKLSQDELVLAAQLVIDRYNLQLPPEVMAAGEAAVELAMKPSVSPLKLELPMERSWSLSKPKLPAAMKISVKSHWALLLSEHPTSAIFPRYYGYCNTSYVVEFLPIHSLHAMKGRPWQVRAKLAAGLLEWARKATDLGFYACDMILGNFGQDADGNIKMNDLDQVHTHDDVHRWADLPCRLENDGRGECFNDGHCKQLCKEDGKCAIMPPHHNTKEVCKRLFVKKGFLAKAPTQRFVKLASVCAYHSNPKSAMKAALELHTLLLTEARDVGAIKPPSFESVLAIKKLKETPTTQKQ